MQEFDTFVQGMVIDAQWLKVGDLYLPLKVDGKDVTMMVTDDDGVIKSENPAKQWEGWKQPVPQDTPARPRGSGVLYEVVHTQVFGRPAPSLAAPVQSVKKKGASVELFEFDETREWRQGLDDYTNLLCWWRLDHEEWGPLLRPQGKPFSAQPMEPLCVAADENLVGDLQRFLDQGVEPDVYDVTGRTPLMIAVEANSLECCILLVEGGASARLRCKPPSPHAGKDVVEIAEAVASWRTLNLMRAIIGHVNFDRSQVDTTLMFHLHPDYQEIVDRLVDTAETRFMSMTEEIPSNHSPSKPKSLVPSDLLAQDLLDAHEDDHETEDVQQSVRRQEKSGTPHAVMLKNVFVRREPSLESERIGVWQSGDVVEVLGFDESGHWGLIDHELFPGHSVPGWMMVHHEQHGNLLRPLEASEIEEMNRAPS